MAKYKRYLHIERLGNDEVEDILFWYCAVDY